MRSAIFVFSLFLSTGCTTTGDHPSEKEAKQQETTAQAESSTPTESESDRKRATFLEFYKKCGDKNEDACEIINKTERWEDLDGCANGGQDSCRLLEELCASQANSCVLSAFHMGSRGNDEKGMDFLNRGCKLGNKEACKWLSVGKKNLKQRQQAQATQERREKAAAAALAKRWHNVQNSKYNIINEDSDYSDAVADGGIRRGSMSFATCRCGLPTVPSDDPEPMLVCLSYYGNHEIYVSGPQKLRKQLATLGSTSERKVLAVFGTVVNRMKRTSSGTYGRTNLEGMFPVVQAADVIPYEKDCN